jgi:hypothetical protein
MLKSAYYRPKNRQELEKQIKALRPNLNLRDYTVNKLWKIRTAALADFERRERGQLCFAF